MYLDSVFTEYFQKLVERPRQRQLRSQPTLRFQPSRFRRTICSIGKQTIPGAANAMDNCSQTAIFETLKGGRALNEVHPEAARISISADTLKHLHGLCQQGSGDAGQFKRLDNDIIQLIPGEAPKIHFKCVPAKQTAAAVDELYLLYRHALDQERVSPLIAAAALVLDFTCIHPFRDGNGRVSGGNRGN